MENKNSTNTPRTAEVRLPGDKLQNEKKMPNKLELFLGKELNYGGIYR